MAVGQRGGRRRRGVRSVAISLAALLLALAGGAFYAYHQLHEPYAGFTGEIYVQIEKGARSRDIARLLTTRGAVHREWVFMLARTLRPKVVLQAGEYRFREPASVWEVQDRLIRGDIFYHAVTIPEGINIFSTARIIARLDWIAEEDVLGIVQSPSLMADLDPAAKSLEGYLFPSTYYIVRGTTAEQICRMMTDQFRKTWNSLKPDADLRETVTLASLVEKETGLPY
jgi:UPF0755 protein